MQQGSRAIDSMAPGEKEACLDRVTMAIMAWAPWLVISSHYHLTMAPTIGHHKNENFLKQGKRYSQVVTIVPIITIIMILILNTMSNFSNNGKPS
jgi:hypothetical protein